jgi:glucose dehydrogenase
MVRRERRSGQHALHTLAQINRDTLSKLKGAWTTPRFDDGGGGRAMPVMKDGKLFITAGSYVYAYDAKTGALVWKHQTGASPPSAGLGDFTRPEQGLPDREGVRSATEWCSSA